MKIFKINKYIDIVCEWKKTRVAFKHIATLMINGIERESVKICYLNRTWESFEFESVIKKLLDKTKLLTPDEKQLCLETTSHRAKKDIDAELGAIGCLALLGGILGQDQQQKNKLKMTALKAGLEKKGLIVPEEWDNLPENEKEARLNGCINFLNRKEVAGK